MLSPCQKGSASVDECEDSVGHYLLIDCFIPCHSMSVTASLLNVQAAAFPEDPSVQSLKDMTSFVDAMNAETSRTKKATEQADKERREAISTGKAKEVDEHDLCSICYASPMDTVFVPCKHKSCRRCIDRNMLNNPRCFFCNAVVESLETLNTIVLHENKETCAESSYSNSNIADVNS